MPPHRAVDELRTAAVRAHADLAASRPGSGVDMSTRACVRCRHGQDRHHGAHRLASVRHRMIHRRPRQAPFRVRERRCPLPRRRCGLAASAVPDCHIMGRFSIQPAGIGGAPSVRASFAIRVMSFPPLCWGMFRLPGRRSAPASARARRPNSREHRQSPPRRHLRACRS